MAYDWRPTATRAATTTAERPVARPSRPEQGGDLRVAEAIEEFVADAEHGHTLNRNGRSYRPSALRDIRGILRHHVAADLGSMRLREVRRRDLQALLDRLAEDGLSESRIRSVVSALRALFGYAVDHGYVEASPAGGLVLPRGEGRRNGGRNGHNGNNGNGNGNAAAAIPWRWPQELRAAASRYDEDDDDRRPIAFLPERILSFVLRIVVVLFIFAALVSVAESF